MPQNRLRRSIAFIKRSLRTMIANAMRFILKRKWLSDTFKKIIMRFPGISNHLKRFMYPVAPPININHMTYDTSASCSRTATIYKKLSVKLGGKS